MQISVQKRQPPVDRSALYGDYAGDILSTPYGEELLRDRAAYMFITGHFPSHLRPKTNGYLRQISHMYRRPTSLDGRFGHRKLKDDAIRALRLNDHDMVKAVREKIREGYFIQKSRGLGTRNGFTKVFMFAVEDGVEVDPITVTLQGAIKPGWD